MLTNNLQNNTIIGVFWTAIQKGGSLVIGFIGNLFLARLLSPDDYGCIGLLLIFTSIADILIDGGLGSALVQKKEISDKDCSTVFTTNLCLSIILFFVLFLCAPAISAFFKIPILKQVLRIESIAIILRSFYIVQASLLQKKLAFQRMSLIMIFSQSVSVIFSVIAAYGGMGIWSLVIKNVLLQCALSIFYLIYGKWKLKLEFSFDAFKHLFRFGGLLALSNFIENVFSNIESFVIGHAYKTESLGYYSQAKTLGQMPIYSISMVANTVLFPVFSVLQNDIDQMVKGIRKSLVSITYIAFPIITLIGVLSEPIIKFLYTSKWLSSSPFLTIICASGLINSVIHTNFSILKASGRSNYYLYSQFITNSIKLILILVGMKWGIIGLLLGHLIGNYIGCAILCMYSGKAVKYGLFSQIHDIYPHFTLSVLLGILFYRLLQLVILSPILQIIVITIVYIMFYLLFSWSLKMKGFSIYWSLLVKRKKQ